MKNEINYLILKMTEEYKKGWTDESPEDHYFTIGITTNFVDKHRKYSIYEEQMKDSEKIIHIFEKEKVKSIIKTNEYLEEMYEIQIFQDPKDYPGDSYFKMFETGIVFKTENYSHTFLPYSSIRLVEEI